MHRSAHATIVHLVLSSGSNAGLVAPIQPGYYLIGRHPECQIRPKTRSVSRRHCLLHHDESGFRVIDLDSTSGTRINEEKIESKRWYALDDGDELRLGRASFTVSIDNVPDHCEASDEDVACSAKRPSAVSKGAVESIVPTRQAVVNAVHAEAALAKPATSIVTGEAWQEFDVASFLQISDDLAREQRYELIRQSDAARRAEDNDEEDGIFEDTPVETDEGTLAEIDPRAVTASQAAGRAVQATSSSPSQTRAAARRSETPSRRTSRFTFGLHSLADPDRIRVLGVVVLTVAVLCYASHSAWQFLHGPPVEIVEGID